MRDVLISAGQVLPGPEGRRIADGAVLVRAGRIAAVGSYSEVAAFAPSEVRRLHRPEATVLPGLINGHVHLAFDTSTDPVAAVRGSSDADLAATMAEHARQLVDSGVTTVRDLGDRSRLSLPLRDEIERGERPGPRVVASGPPLTVPGGHCWFFGGEVDGPHRARALVDEHVAAGVDLIKVMASGGQLTPSGPKMWESQFGAEELAAIVERAHAAGLRVAAHAHGPDAIASSVAAGVDTVEHGSWLDEQLRYAPREPVVAEMAARRIGVCPTHSSNWRGFAERVGEQKAQQLWGRLRWMDELGVPLVCGTDAGLPGSTFDDLVGSFGLLEHLGFSRGRILRMSTVDTAEALGLAGETGVLEAGASADLLVVDGDPLRDLEALRRLELVLVRGRERGIAADSAVPRLEGEQPSS